VFIYVYPENRLLHGIANLGSNVVEDVKVTQGWQPLITPDEASLALITALADADAGRLIREQYQQITGSALRQPDQLRVTAGVYYGADMPIPTARVCGIQRCAQLLLAVPDGAALNVTPIINLSNERVVYSGQ
jgi:hypothetical protein